MEIIKGNIFNSNCQTIVNTVNCYGIMGAGLALECKYRFPEMNERYIEICKNNKLNIGQLYLYKSKKRWILNFPTKNHWKFPSKLEYLEKGLKKFIDTYKEKEIESIAFPMLGAQHGGLSEKESFQVMKKYLSKVNIPVEIYSYIPNSTDDIFPNLKLAFLNQEIIDLKKIIGIPTKQIETIMEAIKSEKTNNMIGLQQLNGIGEKGMQKCYNYALSEEVIKIQISLFRNE